MELQTTSNFSWQQLRVSGLLLSALALVAACGGSDAPEATQEATETSEASETRAMARVDGARLANADAEPGNWMSYGRTYSEQRYSPLDQVTDENVAELGLAWYYDLDTDRGQEATPIVVDGVMYVSTAWSKVKALDAATGELIWEYDPAVAGEKAIHACCDVVNRGVAVWQGKVFVGALDGRLIALDAATGEPAWSVQTTDPDMPYTITGAPRVAKGMVLIGNGGAEFGVRGYVAAYDADSGEEIWRFYTVPGNPEEGFESDAMEAAADTWTGQWWNYGGGGTVWDSIVYDPELDYVYIGVGNGSPWNQAIRSPEGGDNLYLSSIVALEADTGEYVWHYQTTPGDTWDFTATQPLVLAELTIDGEARKVIMQAPKNGFFYVLDRTDGAFISAKPYSTVTWASGIDETGRPIENPDARYAGKEGVVLVAPGPGGAHSWMPMAYNPDTGLVYFPVNDAGFPYADDPEYRPTALGFNTGNSFEAGSMPQIPAVKEQILGAIKSFLVAWDPVKQEAAWRVDYPGPSNGGVLTTAGNLVFEGSAGGDFIAYAADTGDKLWSSHAQTGIIAAPATYTVDGEQYVSVLAGWGGIWALPPGEIGLMSGRLGNKSRVLTFKLGGGASLPPAEAPAPLSFNPPPATATDEAVTRGKTLYHRNCVQCHGDAGISGGMLPDLRASAMIQSEESWESIVLGGALNDRGMVSFAEELDEEDSEAIRAYIIARAHESIALDASAADD